MSHLLLTLGHNSSAILVHEGEILIGYEEERLTKVKSDSSFPRKAMEEIDKHYPLNAVTDVYISHWFTNLTIPLHDQGKWYDADAMAELLHEDVKIHTLNQEFTHHDAHMASVDCFCDSRFAPKSHTLVIDGFGSYGETVSVYHEGVLIHRSFGFDSSLGLYFQYATSFLDLKENQDEYKLLGYESDIGPQYQGFVDKLAIARSDNFFISIMTNIMAATFDPVINISALTATKKLFRDEFQSVLDELDIPLEDIGLSRIIISYYVQTVLEMTVLKLINHFKMLDVRLAGGVFMNVKLNNEIARNVPGKTAIMPLCGDQGAAIGLYFKHHHLRWPGHLFWGVRPKMRNDGMTPLEVVKLLAMNKIVNIVRGNMEFGARALGHTSTLALPTMANVKYINHLNGRSSIMPMAPMLSPQAAETFFIEKDDIFESLHYMICARDCAEHVDPMNYGVTHTMPGSVIRTCRPQIVKNDPFMGPILEAFGVLINTSFNEHGKPILFDMADVNRCHEFQKARDKDDRVVTIVLEE